MRRTTCLAYSLLTATTLQLAACGSDAGPTEEPASFGSASQLQRERMIIAGAGMDPALAMILASSYASAEGAACPAVTRSGDTTTITGGCTLSSGDTLEGKVIATNLPSLLGGGFDPSKSIELTFEDLRFDGTSDEEDLAIDGTVSIAPSGAMTAALSLTISGFEVYSDASWRQDGELTTAEAGSTVTLAGFGAAEIQGRWSMDSDAPAGALELHGTDVLKADFAATVDGCAPLTVDGKAAGQLCQSSDE